MSPKKPLPQAKNGQGDEAMCFKYYEEVLRQEAFNQLPFDDPIEFADKLGEILDSEFDQTDVRQSPIKDPNEYAKTVGGRSITPNEYLDYLGTLGFNIELLNEGVALEKMREKCLDEIREKAEAFFRIFMGEKFDEVDGFLRIVGQEDIEKYIDSLSIYHFIELVVANAASTKARLKAVKRHAEDYAIKNEIFTWLDAQTSNFKRTEDAAVAIKRQQPVAHSTATKYYKEWKKLRSASRL